MACSQPELPNERMSTCQLTTQWAYLTSVITFVKPKNCHIIVSPGNFYRKVNTIVIIYLVFIQSQALC